jgi:hypothetical protein
LLNKAFPDLSMKEKFKLQEIMKAKRAGSVLSPEDEALVERFSEDFLAAEKGAKAKWPIIIGLLVISLLAVLRNCQ